ncbi:MAG: OmpA family protein [Paludibacteraceae bacterium]|nr:OmpA family protein [Paludibacteraceae bacterium]
MKKVIVLATALCLSAALMAQKAEEQTTIKGYHPYRLSENTEVVHKYSHWSLIPQVGINIFDGDFNYNSEMKHAVHYPAVGLGLEYAFTPAWSIGVEGMYDMYKVTGIDKVAADTLLFGHMIKPKAYVALDLVSLFFPHAQKRIFSFSLLAGGGCVLYKSAVYYGDDLRGKSLTSKPQTNSSFDHTGFVDLGASMEFNLNRTLALGVRATYDYILRDDIDGRTSTQSRNNDGIFDITLNMRIKLNAVNRSHQRNIGGEEGSLPVKTVIDAVDMGVSNAPAAPVYVHDTVIIYHDTIYREYHHETITKQVAAAPAVSNQDIYYVYFQSGKAALDQDGLVTIQQVADRLDSDSSLYAVVVGYCDNTGSNSANYALGDKRAESVIDELREEYGIASSHLHATGMGKLVGKRSTASYGPNRRAAIRLVDKATFDRLATELKEQKEQRIREEQAPKAESAKPTVSLSESAKPVKENQYAARPSSEVVASENTTLAQLARKYYNNTHCWVYIYIANKQKLTSPNALVPGMKLHIPELTAEELQTTKDQCLQRYAAARQNK